jgi:hypothetical protein
LRPESIVGRANLRRERDAAEGAEGFPRQVASALLDARRLRHAHALERLLDGASPPAAIVSRAQRSHKPTIAAPSCCFICQSQHFAVS